MSGAVRDAHLTFSERLLRSFSYCVVRSVQRPKLSGVKPPLDEPSIFVCSHVGLMDPLVLMSEYYHWLIHPLIAKDYYDKSRLTQNFYSCAKCIPIDRHHVSTKWLEDSLAALARGEHIIIFPEGKRNKEGKGLLPFRSGAAMLAAKSGARLIPVYNAQWSFPHRYHLTIGEPFRLGPPPDDNHYSLWLKEKSDLIRSKVAALMPESGADMNGVA